eukprot:1796746-Pleurochrysis_carterae.AAC.1
MEPGFHCVCGLVLPCEVAFPIAFFACRNGLGCVWLRSRGEAIRVVVCLLLPGLLDVPDAPVNTESFAAGVDEIDSVGPATRVEQRFNADVEGVLSALCGLRGEVSLPVHLCC